MPRFPMHASSGTGAAGSFPKCIRFVRYGCANRPFYHIVLMRTNAEQRKPPIEQLGSYDPLPNKYNEKLITFNFERIQHWIGQGADVSKPVAQLLGLAGFFPVHPKSYITAWRNRRAEQKKKEEAAENAGGSEQKIEAQS